jgi:hypothetical protein
MRKAIVIGIGLLILMLWSDTVMDTALHLIHILLEILELVVETVLEGFLELTPHQAQFATAWLGLGAAVLVLIVGLRRFTLATQRLRTLAPVWWEEEKQRLQTLWTEAGWPLGVTGLLLLLAWFFLM